MTRAPRLTVTQAVARGLAALWTELLPTGEVPVDEADVLDPGGGRIACSNVLASTIVHDALACLDPGAREFEPGCLDVLARPTRPAVAGLAAAIRRKIRRFIAWQESAAGAWCFYGRASGLGPDSPTTACAAVALLDGAGPRRACPRRVAAVEQFRSPCGGFYTALRGGRGYGSLAADGRPQAALDRVFNAHVLRFAHLHGRDRDALAAWLRDELEVGADDRGSPHHAGVQAFHHALARAVRVAFPPEPEGTRDRLAARVLARAGDDGGLGEPLDAALATLALLDVDRGDRLGVAARDRLLAALTSPAAPGDAYLGSLGSPAFTRALTLAALARLSALHRFAEAAA